MTATLSMGSAISLPAPPFDTIHTDTMSSKQSQPTSGETINAESTIFYPQTPTTKALRDQCITQLNKDSVFAPVNLDHLLELLRDHLPIKSNEVMPSDFLGTKPMSNKPHHIPEKFLTPVFHSLDHHWTLVFVSKEGEGSNKAYVRAQHYDPTPNTRHDDNVKKKLQNWMELHYGKGMELKFELISGPVHTPEQRSLSGQFVVMAANEIARFEKIVSKPEKWNYEPKSFIMGLLDGEHVATRQLSQESSLFVPDDTPVKQIKTSTPTTPAPRPKTSSSKKKRLEIPPFKNDCLTPKTRTPAPQSPLESRKRITASPATRRMATDIKAKIGSPTPYKRVNDARHSSEPDSKRRRVEVDVGDRTREIVSYLCDQELPMEATSAEESDKRIAELRNCEKRYEEENEALNHSNAQYALHENKLDSVSKEYDLLQAEIDEQERAIGAAMETYNTQIPGVRTAWQDKMLAAMRGVLEPEKGNLETKSVEKRQINETLKSAGEELLARQGQVAVAMQEKLSADYEAQKAAEWEEMNAILRDAARNLKECRDRLKKSVETGDWVSGFEERRRQRRNEEAVVVNYGSDI
ncbi:unnamed protein product [Fusarium graminearum]|nr:hypothetical protein FGRA07_03591 [Fusarium graminearum]CAG1998406.1 unnamed protein product [Fusarium graminearum]CAG2012163.1 unnamed protein product [Fusarium graminearum]CZS82880.1 unnamed protein product [Fusarium graminearum]